MPTAKITKLYSTRDPKLLPGKLYTIVVKVDASGDAAVSLLEIEPNQVFTVDEQGSPKIVKPVVIPQP